MREIDTIPRLILDRLDECRGCPLAVDGACPHAAALAALAHAAVVPLVLSCAARERAESIALEYAHA